MGNVTPSAWRIACVFLVLITLVASFIGVAFTGIDFGPHWDEPYLYQRLAYCVRSLHLLPQAYYYNGVYFGIGLLALAPELVELESTAVKAARANPKRPFDPTQYPEITDAQSHVVSIINSPSFALRVRRWYACLSSSTIVWVFVLAFVVRPSLYAALASAALIAASWELGYHSRFAAIDSIFVMLLVLTMGLLLFATTRDGTARVWGYRFAAVALGLSMGTKILAAAAILPLVLSAVLYPVRPSIWGRARHICGLVMVALATLVATTPGLLLDPVRVAGDWAWGALDYSRVAPSYPYFVSSYVMHLLYIARYVAIAGLAPYEWVSVTLTVIGVAGSIIMFRMSVRRCLIFWSFPLLYAALIATSRLSIVRNYLVFLPFVAVAAGVAIHQLASWLRRKAVRGALAVLVVAVCLSNFSVGWSRGRTIRPYTTQETVSMLERYVAEHPELWITYSHAVGDVMRRLSDESANRRSGRPGYCAFFHREINPYDYTANRLGLIHREFGSHEVNFAYYPTWGGRNVDTRVVLMEMAAARAAGVDCPNGMNEDLIETQRPSSATPVLYVNCRRPNDYLVKEGMRVWLLEGATYSWNVRDYGLSKFDGSGLYGYPSVAFRISGFTGGCKYGVAVRWWSFDGADRIQSITMTDDETDETWTLVRPVRLPAFLDPLSLAQPRRLPSTVIADLPVGSYRSGTGILSIVREGGANAVLSDLWVTKSECR